MLEEEEFTEFTRIETENYVFEIDNESEICDVFDDFVSESHGVVIRDKKNGDDIYCHLELDLKISKEMKDLLKEAFKEYQKTKKQKVIDEYFEKVKAIIPSVVKEVIPDHDIRRFVEDYCENFESNLFVPDVADIYFSGGAEIDPSFTAELKKEVLNKNFCVLTEWLKSLCHVYYKRPEIPSQLTQTIDEM